MPNHSRISNLAQDRAITLSHYSRRGAKNMQLKNGRAQLIGCVCALEAGEGVNLLIEAMAELVHGQGRSNVQCAIVGVGRQYPALHDLSGRLGLSDFVTFTGALTGQQLVEAVSTFDVGAIPAPAQQLGVGNNIMRKDMLDYLLLGIAFVSFDSVDGRGAAGDGALYASGDCPLELAGSLAALLDDQSFHAKLVANGRRQIEDLVAKTTGHNGGQGPTGPHSNCCHYNNRRAGVRACPLHQRA